ncbi:YciI family protein [uncultured Elizabethkingia sp.]|uniref:YciI family protein n=1 Tax=uncultured Elizabethkingia sp. TaxID=432638 RepID=UPI0025922951|nr:YciI family protein [uncultured Elizabethkingia sp.]
MKAKIFLTGIAILSTVFLQAQTQSTYNEKLAKDLGADKYGMKKYMFVILKSGKTELADKAKRAELIKGHLTNIGKLAEAGKLIVAGPFLEKNDKNYKGIFILNSYNKEETETLLKSDPAIAAGIFDVEIYPWYGSAALPTYLENHKKIVEENP